jgi:hypothetical protein
LKKLDFGQMAGLLANLGVIAGIIFLALELRQNNELMETASRQTQNDRIHAYIMQVYEIPGLAEILVKHRNREPLTEAEGLQLYARKLRLLRGFEAQYRESTLGSADPVPTENWVTNFYDGTYANPALHDVWEEAKLVLRPEFVQFFQENVVNER